MSDMRWRKLGLVYRHRDLRRAWMASHAANPVAGEIAGDTVRVYFNCRDGRSRSYVAWADLDLSDPLAPAVSTVCDEPVLGPGERGMFDDSGTSLGNIVWSDKGAFLYYLGWNLGVTVPWHNTIGLAIRRPGKTTFERYSRVPIVDRSEDDPLTLTYPWVLHEDGAWHLWYGSHTRWNDDGGYEHVIKYASSADGLHWQRHTAAVLAPSRPGEFTLNRPCVLRLGGLLHMWYCAKGDSYRVFHATSQDGLTWTRRPVPEVDVSPGEWDSDMTCYPSVFEHNGRRYLLYNGNAYGRDGFGIATSDATS